MIDDCFVSTMMFAYRRHQDTTPFAASYRRRSEHFSI